MNVLDRFSTLGIRFRLDGDKVTAIVPGGPPKDELRCQLKDAKELISAELQAMESRRRRVLSLLAEQPGRQYAVIYDGEANPDYDVLVVAIPEASFELRMPKAADSLEFAERLMQVMDRRGEERKAA